MVYFVSLREKQIEAIKRVLNLNQPVALPSAKKDDVLGGAGDGLLAPGEGGEPVWKVLVFDDLGRDVISSVLRVSDLRAMGVTMHMHLGASRYPIRDVPVVYLMEPKSANLQTVTADLQRGLYSPAYVNFLSSVSRPLLEEFAEGTVASNTAEHIAQLYDQYLNFIVTEPNLFSLGMQKDYTFWALNSPKATDASLERILDQIVTGLYSVIVTMGVVPVIRSPRGGPSEMIATKLDRKLRDHVVTAAKDGNHSPLFGGRPSSRAAGGGGAPGSNPASARPVLILLDRNVDLTPMLSHSWTYQSLVHDILSVSLNRVTIETPVDENDPAQGTTKKVYDLTSKDFFWAQNAGLPFPQVAEHIDAELTKYKEDTAEIMKKTGSTSIEDLENDHNAASVQHLKAAITLLPELRERKATLDMHVNILAALLAGIKDRQIDNFFQMEEDMTKHTKAQMLEFIKDPSHGNQPLDKLRLFINWSLTTSQEISHAEWKQFVDTLESLGVDPVSLAYIHKVRATALMSQVAGGLSTTTAASSSQAPSASADIFGRFSSLSTRLTDRLKETGVPSGLSANFESLIGGLKNFLPVNRDFILTQIVESIMDPSAASSSAIAKTEDYLYYDPRNAHARGTLPPVSRGGAGGGGGGGGGGSTIGGVGSIPGGGGAQATFGQRRQGYSDAIVFTVGGGSMDEYGNLQEWVARTGGPGNGTHTGSGVASSTSGLGIGSGGDGMGVGAGNSSSGGSDRRVVYGSTELLSSEAFIRDALEKLGREVN